MPTTQLNTYHLRIAPELTQWPALMSFAERCQLDGPSTLILEEAASNVVHHSGATELDIEITIEKDQEVIKEVAQEDVKEDVKDEGQSHKCVTITITDDGVYFDPTKYTPTQSDELVVGGQGIRLIQALSEKITYKRENQKNILTIKKSL